jgi:hypothetical protein
VFERTIESLDGPLLALDDTDLAACRAGLLGAQRLGLLEGGGFQGSRRQSLNGGGGHFLHLVHIDVQSRPLLAKSMPDNNFPPLLGDHADAVKVGGRQLSCSHDLSILGVMTISAGEFPRSSLINRLYCAKGFLHSPPKP